MEEARGSIPLSSTVDAFARVFEVVGYTLGGLVAAEGCFSIHERRQSFADGTPRRRFRFTLNMAERDRRLVEATAAYLGCGGIYVAAPQRPGWQATVSLQVSATDDLLRSVVPFAERFVLAPSQKRQQFLSWRDDLQHYVAERPTQWGRGRSRCAVDGCKAPVRGRGLCRSHYYRATGY